MSTPTGRERIRLWGVDAPESAQTCTDAAGAPFACGKQATQALKQALGGDAPLVSCTVKDRDQYGRAVASCTGAPGVDAGKAMVETGNAVEYKKFSKGVYTAAERDAKASKKGIWAGSFERPDVYRRETHLQEQIAASKGQAPPKKGGAPPARDPPPPAFVQPTPAPAVAPGGATAPPDPKCAIKGNRNQRGKRFYFVPSHPYYADVKIDVGAGERVPASAAAPGCLTTSGIDRAVSSRVPSSLNGTCAVAETPTSPVTNTTVSS